MSELNEKKVKTRIVHKHDTAENWAKATSFIPKRGELIIYDDHDAAGNVIAEAVKYKIGDGVTLINDLPFADVKGLPVVDENVGYTKQVPADSASYAKINKVGGMSYKTKNLTQIADGTISITDWYYDNANLNYTFKPNTTYTISFDYQFVSTSADSIYCGIGYGTTNFEATLFTKSYPNLTKGTMSLTFTTPSSFGERKGNGYARFIGGNAPHTTSIMISRVMLNEEATALPYEPYFDGLKDSKVTEIKSIGANVLNIEGNEFGNGKWFRTMNNGLTIHSFAAGKYTFTSKDNYLNITAYDNSGYHWLSRFVELEPNTDYRLSISGISCIIVGLADNAVNTVGTQLTLTNKVFNSGNYKYWMISFYSTGASNVMISKGEQVQEFAPYKESALPVPTSVQALDGYGEGVNESVYNYIDFEKKQFVKRVNKINLGALSWYTSAAADSSIRFQAIISGRRYSLYLT